jgi:hypothetical protein
MSPAGTALFLVQEQCVDVKLEEIELEGGGDLLKSTISRTAESSLSSFSCLGLHVSTRALLRRSSSPLTWNVRHGPAPCSDVRPKAGTNAPTGTA